MVVNLFCGLLCAVFRSITMRSVELLEIYDLYPNFFFDYT